MVAQLRGASIHFLGYKSVFMKILLEASTLFTKGFTGIPHYIIHLHSALMKNENTEVLFGLPAKKVIKQRPDFINQRYLWYAGQFLLSSDYKPDISHSLHSPFLKIKGTKKIATIHDLAVHLPEFSEYDFANKYFRNKRFKLFKEFAENADAIIAVSHNTKEDFLKFFNFPEEKIHVIHLAPVIRSKEGQLNNMEILTRFSLARKEYFLSVGVVSLRKNSLNLIKGYALSEARKDKKLVIAGKAESEEYEKALKYIRENKLEDNVIFTNYISDEILSVLYENAAAFLFPTFYEGFGIPIIEAMNHKLPVLTSTSGAAPEVANGHAVLVNPIYPKEIARGIEELEKFDERRIMEAKKYAQTFTWKRVAQQTIEVYNSLV